MTSLAKNDGLKASISTVKVGHISLPGLMDEIGNYYVGVPQIADMTEISRGTAARDFKRLMGKGFKTSRLRTEFNKAYTLGVPLSEFEKLMAKMDRAGNPKAQEFRDELVGLSLHQLFSDAFGVEISATKRQNYLETRQENSYQDESEAIILAGLRLKELEMQNTLLDKQLALRHVDNTMLTLHGAPTVLALRGCQDQVVEIEKPTIEVIDEKSGAQFKGMTLAKINEFVSKKHGIKHKSGAEIARFIHKSGNGHLIGQIPRRQLCDYVPEENVQEVINLIHLR